MPRDSFTEAAHQELRKVFGIRPSVRFPQPFPAFPNYLRIVEMPEMHLERVRDSHAVGITNRLASLLEHGQGVKDELADLRVRGVKGMSPVIENGAFQVNRSAQSGRLGTRLENDRGIC